MPVVAGRLASVPVETKILFLGHHIFISAIQWNEKSQRCKF